MSEQTLSKQLERETKRVALYKQAGEQAQAEADQLRTELAAVREQLNEALGVLGYPVPGDTPTPRYKCGLCEANEQQLADLQGKYNELRSSFGSGLLRHDIAVECGKHIANTFNDMQRQLAEAQAKLETYELGARGFP